MSRFPRGGSKHPRASLSRQLSGPVAVFSGRDPSIACRSPRTPTYVIKAAASPPPLARFRATLIP